MHSLIIPAEGGLFDQITGLPVHPLVVHFAVVLLPLASLALILLVLVPRLRTHFAGLTTFVLVIGAAATWVAEESGEELAARIGEPAQHAWFAGFLVPVAAATAVLAVVWYLVQRGGRRSGLVTGTGVVTSIAALASVGLTALVGHSGAVAVWEGQTTPATASAGASASASATASATASAAATPTTSTTTAAGTFTLAQIATHATAADCWVAVDGNAYDLTDWIPTHPGGPAVLTALCGTDATTAFARQHGTQSEPNAKLASYLLGKLA